MRLKVTALSKEYHSFGGLGERLLAAATLGIYRGTNRVSALENLSFEAGQIGQGEIIGIIGANGAGKSTLLRLLAGNAQASSGRVEYSGSMRSMLELGVGFSPELTGRENIYYNGRLLGYTAERLKKHCAEILEFASLTDSADLPLKVYSTGMRMRLGFSLATFERCDLFPRLQ